MVANLVVVIAVETTGFEPASALLAKQLHAVVRRPLDCQVRVEGIEPPTM